MKILNKLSRYTATCLISTILLSPLVFSENISVDSTGTPSDDALRKAKEIFENKAEVSSRARNSLEKINTHINSTEYQDEQKNIRDWLMGSTGADAWEKQSEDSGINKIPYSDRPILFISSSVPISTLRAYARDMQKIDGLMVLRGFIGGVSQAIPTLEFMANVLKVDANCTKEPCERFKTRLVIDPILFREYGITSVPAFTVHGETNLQAYCAGTEGLNPGGYVVYGDGSINHLVRTLKRESGDKSLAPIEEMLEI